MQSLVRENLVRQIIPSNYFHLIPNYVSSFVQYLESLGPELERRRTAFQNYRDINSSKIHIEKMNELGYVMEQLGLAKLNQLPWYIVEYQTAEDFMLYLAGTLGQVNELQYLPVSDSPKYLKSFLAKSSPDLQIEGKILPLRLQIMQDLFPTPNRSLTAYEIYRIKERYGDQLIKLRRKVERELIGIASIPDPEMQNRSLELFRQEIKDETEEIKSNMKNFGITRVLFGKFISIIASIPGMPSSFGLLSSIYNAFGTVHLQQANNPFLYAAFVQNQCLTKRYSELDPPPAASAPVAELGRYKE